jgi:hypothetical protein
MATEAQVEANRTNAQKSTGPRTPEGKEKAAQNALKHGLLAKDAVVVGEDLDEFDLFRDQLGAELAPVGLVEARLVERIAGLIWRLQRAERFHTETFDVLYAKCDAEPQAKRWRLACGPEHADPVVGLTVVKDFSETRVLERLLMYERRIENSLCRMMAELRQVQGQRRAGGAVPATSPRAGVRDTPPADLSRAEEDRPRRPSGTVRETLPPDFTLDNLLAKIAALEDQPAGAVPNAPADLSCETKPISQLRPPVAAGGDNLADCGPRSQPAVTTLRIQDGPAAGCSLPPAAPGPRETVVQTNPIGPSPACETKPICGGGSSRQGGYTPIFRRRR